jgi:hypothetical protein
MVMRLSELSRRWMLLIYMSALAISGILLFFFVVSPELTRYRSAVDEYNSEQQEEMRQITRLEALINEYQTLRAKADKASKLLFTKHEAEVFFEELPKLAKRTRIDLKSISPQNSRSKAPPRPKKPNPKQKGAAPEKPSPLTEIAVISVPMSISGEYGDVITMFKNLEDGYEQLMALGDVSFSASGRDRTEVSSRVPLDLIHTKSEVKGPSPEIVSAIDAITEAMKAGGESRPPVPERKGAQAATGPRQESSESRPGAAANVRRWTVVISVTNFESSKEELEKLMKSRGYEPWVWREVIPEKPPYPVLVGKLRTESQANRLGELLVKELSWVDEYTAKETRLHYDTVLKETIPGKERE